MFSCLPALRLLLLLLILRGWLVSMKERVSAWTLALKDTMPIGVGPFRMISLMRVFETAFIIAMMLLLLLLLIARF